MSLKHLIPATIRRWLFWRQANFFAVVKKCGHALGIGKLTWKMSRPSEIKFWDRYLQTRGKSCDAEAEFAFRTSPDSEFQPWLREWITTGAPELRALDVGAGPLTWIGKTWPGRNVSISAIDPLAESYHQLMARYGIVPPVRTETGEGEQIVERFGREVFDLVFARNSLDHSFDAIRAVKSIVEVTKPGGVIFLWHYPDEGEGSAYQGLHQWNFRLDKRELLVWRPNETLNVNQFFADRLGVLRCELRDGMIQAVFRKR